MKRARIIIFPLVGGVIGFGVHLVWHFLMGLELFYFGSHVVSGVVYTLTGMVLGIILYLAVSKK